MKKNLLHILPAFFFFFIAFSLINFTQGLMLKQDGIESFSYVAIFFAALVVAKVLILVDHFPVFNLFIEKPLIYNIFWKTFLYTIASIFVRFILRFHTIIDYPYLLGSVYSFRQTINLTIFWTVQIWYLLLFFIFAFCREFFEHYGPSNVLNVLFIDRRK